jgi:hypothetical protein
MKPARSGSEARRSDDAAEGPVLVLGGGVSTFLTPARIGSGAAVTSTEPRLLMAREVMRSEVLFRNGLGRAIRACHLVWSHSAPGGRPRWTLGEMILPN